MYDERIILYPFIVLSPTNECSFIDYKKKETASLFIKQNLLAELKNRLKISIFLWRKSCASR